MGKKKESFLTDITDKGELDEIRKISGMLNADEKVLLVARQARFRPGGSHFGPNVVYATDRRIILRDPSMLGLKQEIIEIPYNVITHARIDKGVFSASVIFNAPGLFNPNISGRVPWIKNLHASEHGENGVIDAIPKKKADDLIEIIRNGITQVRAPSTAPSGGGGGGGGSSPGVWIRNNTGGLEGANSNSNSNSNLSVAEELSKLAELRDKGILSDEEFKRMKERIIERK